MCSRPIIPSSLVCNYSVNPNELSFRTKHKCFSSIWDTRTGVTQHSRPAGGAPGSGRGWALGGSPRTHRHARFGRAARHSRDSPRTSSPCVLRAMRSPCVSGGGLPETGLSGFRRGGRRWAGSCSVSISAWRVLCASGPVFSLRALLRGVIGTSAIHRKGSGLRHEERRIGPQ